MGNNAIADKSKAFAIETIKMCKRLMQQNEYVLSKQLLKSGTSIGANVHEAIVSQSKKEFVAKMNIALKEANETEYWLELLYETDYIAKEDYPVIKRQCKELIMLLTSIIKTSNKALNIKSAEE